MYIMNFRDWLKNFTNLEHFASKMGGGPPGYALDLCHEE